MNKQSSETGSTNPLLIASILLGLLAAGFAGFSVWAFMGYQDYKNNSDAKVATAVDEAKSAQKTELEAEFVEREKEPYRNFVGPEDLGSVTFKYPKTWSVYVDQNDPSRTFEAYLNPGVVPPVSNTQAFAVRVIIEDKEYPDSIKSYESLVKKGDLKSVPIEVNGFKGIRLDGSFGRDRSGSAVVFKLRDKTLTLATDVSKLQKDFDNVVVKSLKFNP